MYLWGIRITTYITNTLVLIGYALLLNWLQTTQAKFFRDSRVRKGSQLGLTTAFVLLFHFASIFEIWHQNHAVGFGWTYITFQAATILFALLTTQAKSMLIGQAALLLWWYWWLPGVPNWLPWFGVTLVTMILIQRYQGWIGNKSWLYYLVCAGFAAPFMAVNLQSLGGIDVGWPWLIGTYLSLCVWLWAVHFMLISREQQQRQLRQDAQIDELTGLNNFRVFNEDLQAYYRDQQARQMDFALFAFDIDHFKKVNDRYGHLTGNDVLRDVARTLRKITMAMPYPAVKCYRTGGEEFSLIITQPDAGAAELAAIAWQIHDAIGRLELVTPSGATFKISVSIGADCARQEDRNYLEVYNRADQYLYQSKHNGRDTVTVRGETLKPQVVARQQSIEA